LIWLSNGCTDSLRWDAFVNTCWAIIMQITYSLSKQL